MACTASRTVLERIESLYGGGTVIGLTDHELIKRFTSQCDSVAEAAFAALVARHGSMILGVCQHLLGDRHDAEDSFQAVFLVLARKAKSIQKPELLCNSLYGVALRTSRKARNRLAGQRKREKEILSRPVRHGLEVSRPTRQIWQPTKTSSAESTRSITRWVPTLMESAA